MSRVEQTRFFVRGVLAVAGGVLVQDVALADAPGSEPSTPPSPSGPSPAAPTAPVTAAPPPPPAATSTASFPLPCASNQFAADGSCVVSPAVASPPEPSPPAPAATAVVVSPGPPPIPTEDAGARAVVAPNTALLAGGLALFAAGYATTIGVNFGVCGPGATWSGCDSKGLSFVPVVGPFIFAGIENTEPSYRVLAVALGLTQAAGAVLFGLSFAGSSGESTPKTAYVLPAVSRDGAGATVVGRF